MTGFALWNLYAIRDKQGRVEVALNQHPSVMDEWRKTMKEARKHALLPSNVAGVVDEVEIARQLGEYMYQICTGKFGSEKKPTQGGAFVD